MSTSPKPAPLKPAATILMLRDDPAFEVLMVRRHHEVDSVPGALVFPGGKTRSGDHDPAWSPHLVDGDTFASDERALRIAAVREVFEEVGLLVARDSDGRPFKGEAFDLAQRAAVDRGEIEFLDLIKDLGVKLDLPALILFARWITPKTAAKRFDTWFYVARAPGDQLAVCDGREMVDAEWLAPLEALRLGETGERRVVFPTRMNLKMLAEAEDADDALARAAARTPTAVEPEVVMRSEGRTLVLHPDAGYGAVEVLLAEAGGVRAPTG